MADKERVLCPTCGKPGPYGATDEELAQSPPYYCSPLRCSEWKVVGKATRPHPITGATTMLRLVEDDPDV